MSVSCYVKEDLYAALQKYCRAEDLRHTALLRELLKQELRRKGYWP